VIADPAQNIQNSDSIIIYKKKKKNHKKKTNQRLCGRQNKMRERDQEIVFLDYFIILSYMGYSLSVFLSV
jgi:hypothetical protein